MGLPGSGKSTWAKSQENKNTKHIEFDKCCIVSPKYFSLEQAIKEEIKNNLSYKNIILDFIFYTQEDLIKIIEYTKEFNIQSIEIKFWNENRERCIINDRIRKNRENRKYSCESSIKNSKFEKPNIEFLNKKYEGVKFKMLEYNVYRGMSKEEFILKINDGRSIIVNDCWSQGGTWRDCWGNGGTISPEEPYEFEKFDEILEKICPNINYINYKKIKRACVRMDTFEYGDYYGGCDNRARWELNLEDLYEKLDYLGLI